MAVFPYMTIVFFGVKHKSKDVLRTKNSVNCCVSLCVQKDLKSLIHIATV